MKRILLSIGLLYFLLSCSPDGRQHDKVMLKIKVLDEETGELTPVMACISSIKEGVAFIPPSGEKVNSYSLTPDFYEGIEYKIEDNWIGPVRRMNGRGDNEDRSYVYEDLSSIPHWKDPVIYQTTGDFSITLAPDEYQISLEHGMEYIPIKEKITIEGDEKLIDKTFSMKRWINLPAKGWYSGDVHVHHPTTRPAFKQFLMEYAKAEDIHLVNVLEMGHHLGTDFKQEGFGEMARTCEGDICLVSGQEGPRSTYGHIIGLNIKQMERDTTQYNYYDLIFKKLQMQEGAVVGFAHFSWNGCDLPRGFPWYITTEDIDFVELLQFSKINAPDYYDYLNLGFRISAAAGSDIPWGSTLGEVRTFVYTGDSFSADYWFEGLKTGRTFVSNGPAVILEADGNYPGREIIRDQGFTSKIMVNAFSHPGIGIIERVEIYNNDGLVHKHMNSEQLDSLTINLDHTLDKSQWLTAAVYCENGAVAHTSPIYFIVDGKPTWNPDKAPAIIDLQMDLIQVIDDEEHGKDVPDKEILDRLDNARRFYQAILDQIRMNP
jgi:hypothetical protein